MASSSVDRLGYFETNGQHRSQDQRSYETCRQFLNFNSASRQTLRLYLGGCSKGRVRYAELEVSLSADILRLHVLQLCARHIFCRPCWEKLVAHTSNRDGDVCSLATKSRYVLCEAYSDGGGCVGQLLLAANLLSATPFLEADIANAS